MCPAVKTEENGHSIKFKKLVSVKLEENENSQFVCWICKKQLSYQRVSASKRCGHVCCKECITKLCKLDKDSDKYACSICSKKFNHKDIIDLKESGSAFASHSQVEAKVIKPTFHC